MKLDKYDRIECVCLDNRCNEWRRLEKQFKEKNAYLNRFIVGKGKILDTNLYNQVDPVSIPVEQNWNSSNINAYCCYVAHKTIIQNAKNKNLKNLLMVEDDCQLLNNFDEILEAAMKQIQDLNIKWDMLYYGSNHTWAQTEHVSENIIKLRGGTYCWHCVGINQEYHDMFEHLLNLPGQGPFDLLTANYTQQNPELNCYAIWPTIAIQKPGMSYVEGAVHDYTGYFNSKGRMI